ncbi:MAG: ATP-binding protein [Clostridia bacterium]|nr:ATP-binding protein [Clostridia bacterium]
MSENQSLTIKLCGRIDSGNAAQIENEIMGQLSCNPSDVVMDAAELDYISSAGLRVILHVRKLYSGLRIINVKPEVYDIFDMTGFCEMMSIEKAFRVVDITGCEVIGEGNNGKVYRIDRDNVVKTYKNADALSEIQHEREVARLALILGVPTAISYDVVRVGDSYGSVFELLNARSFSKILATEPERIGWCEQEYVGMLKKLHAIEVPEGKLPSAKEKVLRHVSGLRGKLPQGLDDKLISMCREIPESDHLIHGDFHTKNIVLSGDEVLIIDMDTLSVGHPIFELVPMFKAYIGYSESDPGIIQQFQGYGAGIAKRFWHDSLTMYLGTDDENEVKRVEEKISCLAYAELLDWGFRHKPDDRNSIDLWREKLIDLLGRVDSLLFEVNESAPAQNANRLEVEADVNNLEQVISFIRERAEAAGCSVKDGMQIDLAVEEIFVNIANYAYAPGSGNAVITVKTENDPAGISITFTDSGKPYDPLKKEDPDITLSAEERNIGGLGIFMTKKIMDSVEYEYRDGQNNLTLRKYFKVGIK